MPGRCASPRAGRRSGGISRPICGPRTWTSFSTSCRARRVERNDQTSGGVVFWVSAGGPAEPDLLPVGAQLEYMSGHLDQWQAEAADRFFRLQQRRASAGLAVRLRRGQRAARGLLRSGLGRSRPGTRLVHSLRLEYLEYDYDNLMLDGNTRDDGTTCGFGGCLYNRPASRKDDFTNLAGTHRRGEGHRRRHRLPHLRQRLPPAAGDRALPAAAVSGRGGPRERGARVAGDRLPGRLLESGRLCGKEPTTSFSGTAPASTSATARPRPGESRRRSFGPGATTPSRSPGPTPSTSTTSTAASPAASPSRRTIRGHRTELAGQCPLDLEPERTVRFRARAQLRR